jgi:ABC-2 type transport system permease protein
VIDRAPEAEIIDVRYSRRGGARSGRASAVAVLARQGAMRAMGARRGWQAKLIPIALVAAAMGPALVVLGVRALFAEFSARSPIDILDALPYAGYQSVIGMIILVFAVVLAPDLLCPDRRDGTLALYFATAVGRDEYVFGRFLGCAVPLLLVTLAPMLLLFGGVAFFDDDAFGYVADEWRQLPRIIAAGMILAVYYASVALAVASFTGRRAYAVGGYVLLLVATTAVAVVVQESLGRARFIEVSEISTMPIEFVRMLWPETAGETTTPWWAFLAGYCAIVGASWWLMLRRYRREQA